MTALLNLPARGRGESEMGHVFTLRLVYQVWLIISLALFRSDVIIFNFIYFYLGAEAYA